MTDAKASLHSGSHFHHGLPYRRWPRPLEFGPGATRLYTVWVPTAELTPYVEEPKDEDKAKIVLIPPAPDDTLTAISVVQTTESVELGPPRDLAAELLACWPLRSGNRIWVLVTYNPYPEHDKRLVAERKAGARAAGGSEMTAFLESEDHGRMMLWLMEDDGRFGMIDVSPHETVGSTAQGQASG